MRVNLSIHRKNKFLFFSAIEIKDLPLDVRNVQKHSVKRKQIGQRKKSKAVSFIF